MTAITTTAATSASQTTLLVTGASGQLGRRVLDLLLDASAGAARARGARIVAASRTPDALAGYAARGVEVRRADFDDDATLSAAFAGVTRALVISTDALDRPGRRIAQHRRAIAALAAAGVRHVVYTSLPNPVGSPALVAADHAATEAALADSPLDYTVLRNSLYADYLVPGLRAAVAAGQLVDARGGAAIAYVTRDDCARAAAGALAGSHGGRTVVDVTGPAAIAGDELAAMTGELAGRSVAHVSVPPAALLDGLLGHGMPRPLAELLVSFDAAAVRGDYAKVSSAVADFGGAAPTSLRAFLAERRAALVDAPAGATSPGR